MDIRPNSQRSNARETARERLEEHAEGLARSRAATRAAAERIAQARRDSIETARESHSSRDEIELSSTARLLGAAEGEDRASLVAELKAAYENGTLNTAERIRAAAERLLGG
jgi:anti-sigma28 factor (negative regulator of flagellin synthesis)